MDDPPADNNDPPADENETGAPKFDGFDFAFSEGDFWEYQWDSYVNKWAQGSGGSTTETDGTFRVTLRSSRVIDGVTAYEVYLSGIPGSSNADFGPRWKYVALAENKILDLFLFDSSGAVQLGQSFEDNPATGDYTESIKQFLDAGTYAIGLQAFKANAKEIYTLSVQNLP